MWLKQSNNALWATRSNDSLWPKRGNDLLGKVRIPVPEGRRAVATGGAGWFSTLRNPWKEVGLSCSAPAGAEEKGAENRTRLRFKALCLQPKLERMKAQFALEGRRRLVGGQRRTAARYPRNAIAT